MASAQWAVKLPTSNLVAAKRHLVTVTPLGVVWPGRAGNPREVPAFLHFLLDNLIGL